MAEDKSYNDINDLSEDWMLDERNGLPYSGKSVQKFIKTQFNGKVSCMYFDSQTMTIYGFANQEDRDYYIQTGDGSKAVDSCKLEFATVQTKIVITNDKGSSNLYFTTSQDTAPINLEILSYQKGLTDIEWNLFTEDFLVTVSVDRGGNGNYETIRLNDPLVDSNKYTVDIKNFIATGNNRVRVSVTGSTSGVTSNVIYNITLTSMYLEASNFGWYNPFVEGEPYNLGGMHIGGALDKLMKVRVTGLSGSPNSTYEKLYEKNMGTATYINTDYFFQGLEFPNAGTGVYNVDIWLDASGLESDHLNYNIMCVAAEEKLTAKLIAINEAADKVYNYAENKLFKYAMYNGGSVVATPHVTLSAIINTSPIVLVEEDLNDMPTGMYHEYTSSLEMETEETSMKLNAVITFGNTQQIVYPIDNSMSFPATPGPSLYFNAAQRSNAQENREYIVDIPSGTNYAAEWTKMSWVDGIDGWTVNSVGRKCLYLPAGSRCKVTDMAPMSSFGAAKTIEINFRCDNVSDTDEPIITLQTSEESNFRGIRIYPEKVIVHSRDLDSADLMQSYSYDSEEDVNLIISIIRNYKTNYGNICIGYCNGDKVFEFEFANADSWLVPNSLEMGSNTADLSVYSFRPYEQGFAWNDAVKNYLNSLPNTTDKSAVKNSIMSMVDDSYNIDYDLVSGKYNTMVVEMLNGADLPHYGLSKEYGAKCNLYLNILHEDSDKPILSGAYENTDISGQGTTSMNYWLWNLRWKKLLIRLTAKKNYASSMQSHKIGATRAFNDLHHYLGLDNEAEGFVAVYQYPVYGFQKIKVESQSGTAYTYKFIGLFTIGPDKGDKSTFGYDKSGIKEYLIHLEGTDHNIKGVGYDYPYSRLKYVADKESICVVKGGDNYDAAFEVGASGTASTEAEVQSYLDQEFAPAYNVAYDNSTMIYGTSRTLEEINANVDAFGNLKDESGNALQRYEIWIDGEYNLYYLDKETNQYTANGVNLLTDLGLTEDDISGMTIGEKNNLFKEKRRERFKANMQKYWDLEDNLFCLVFFFIYGLSDNFKKNMYPYKMKLLADGGRWRQRQDDTDTLGDIDNQGLSSKGYSIEFHDWTDNNKTAYVFKGEDSVFWTLLRECYPTEIKVMGRKVLAAMYALSDTGTTTIDKLMGFIDKYFWQNAQKYFSKSAYNVDAEYAYEEAWYNYSRGNYNVDVHPLSQSKGRHFEAERNWFRKRLIYCMSKFNYGCFTSDGYNDTSLGRITFRTQLAQSLELTPAMDLYPVVLSGQSATHTSQERVAKGESVVLSGVGGTNTNVYIMGSDVLESIGDLCKLTVDSSSNATLTVSSKALKTLKLGDDVADNVTSNVEKLDITYAPSLMDVNARNLSSLTGTVDLSRCPRLDKALFGGTDVRQVTLPQGSKISVLELPDGITVIDLRNLKFLTTENLSYNALNNVQFTRIEGCSRINAFAILRSIYESESSQLKDIRVTGFVTDGTADDCTMLAHFVDDLDKDGNPHQYNGIDIDGTPNESTIPYIEGTINVDGYIFENDYKRLVDSYSNLIINMAGFYINFADAAVGKLCADNWGDGVGVTTEAAAQVTSLGTVFKGNTEITSFNELGKFGVTKLNNGEFANCSNLTEVDLSNIETLGGWGTNGTFYGTGIKVVNMPNLKKLSPFSNEECTFMKSAVERIESLGEITVIPNANSNWGFAKGAVNLRAVVLPETLTSIGTYAFHGCTSLANINLENVERINDYAFAGCTALTRINMPSLLNMGYNTFQNCTSLTKVESLGSCSILNNNAFSNDGLLETVHFSKDLRIIQHSVFPNCMVLSKIYIPNPSENWFRISMATDTSAPFRYSKGGDIYDEETGEVVTSMEVPADITAIPNYSLMYWRGERVTCAEGSQLTSIGQSAFYGCSNLQSVDIPSGVTSIGQSAFYGCSNLQSFTVEDGESGLDIAASCFSECNSEQVTGLFEKIVTLGASSFYNSSMPKGDVTLPKCTTIGPTCFRNATLLTALRLPSIESISDAANNEGMVSYCPKIKLIDIGENCISIGGMGLGRQFGNKDTGFTLIVRAVTPPTLSGQLYQYLNSNVSLLGIYVPDESVDAYKEATNWTNYSSRIKPLSEYVESE
jgi:hypothetical protein